MDKESDRTAREVTPPWDPPWDEPVTRVYFPPGSFDSLPVEGVRVPMPPVARKSESGVVAVEDTGDDVGSTEFWRDVHEGLKILKAGRVEKAKAMLSAEGSPFRQCSPSHWQARLPGGLLDWWPSTAKWRWKGRTHQGDAAALAAFMHALVEKT